MNRSRIAIALFAVTLLVACNNSPSPSPSPVASATSSPAPSSAAPTASAVTACTSADIRATGGAWGGAAGSRGSDIVVENIGAASCLLPAGATVAVVDQAGTVLLSNTPPPAGPGPEVAPGGIVGFSLVLGNWCDQPVGLPFHLQLALATDSIAIDDLAVTTADDLPPCNGPGQPATLSTSDWQPG
jgi:hypothetical protein